MVRISALHPYCPNNPSEFTTNPYDVIGKEEEKELKQNPNSLIHLILPDGEGDEVYNNALKAYKRFKASNIITKEEKPSIFVYRQESPNFSQEGLILGISLHDYEENNIVKHEYTRVEPLKDRIMHITTTNVAAGLVWTVFRHDIKIKNVIEQIKQKKPKFDFNKYGYRHIVWQEDDLNTISTLSVLFKDKKVYIADGHHRAASAAEYRKIQIENAKEKENSNSPWQFLLSYVASDDQIRILPYNRVIRRLKDGKDDFLERLKEIYEITKVETAFNPNRKNQVALCIRGQWYKLETKVKSFESILDSLDVAILQDKVLGPILRIINIRTDDNIFFVGGLQDPKLMEEYTTEKGYDVFINLYPVDIEDLEAIADSGRVMPPKSTWFDPKLLSGLVLHDLSDEWE